MRRIRPVLSGLLVAGFLLGLSSLTGCGNSEEGSAPKLSGSKDEIQKAKSIRYSGQACRRQAGARWLTVAQATAIVRPLLDRRRRRPARNSFSPDFVVPAGTPSFRLSSPIARFYLF